MYSTLILLMTLGLSMSAPFSKFDLKRSTDSADDKLNGETTGKLLSIVPNESNGRKDESTLLVSEELVFASTGYPTFDAFDQNSNGFIEFDEFASSDGKDHKNNFRKADTDGDQKLSPEEFSRLSLVVYEPEQFSDSDEEPAVVFLTPPESITKFSEKEMNAKPETDSGFDDYREIPSFVSVKEERKDDKPNEDKEDVKDELKKINKEENKTEDKTKKDEKSVEKVEKKAENNDKLEKSESKATDADDKEGSHFTAEDMPVKIDDEDDEDMIEVKDEDIPMEVIDDLSDENRYELEEAREPQEDDKQMNDQLNSIE